MRMRTNNENRRVSYTKLVDLLNNWLDIQEAKNRNCEDILKELDQNLCDRLQTVPNWKEKHINHRTVSLLEKLVPENVTPQQVYMLIRRFSEYRMDSTDFQKIQNVYTILRYYENPKQLQLDNTDWKDIMGKKRYKS